MGWELQLLSLSRMRTLLKLGLGLRDDIFVGECARFVGDDRQMRLSIEQRERDIMLERMRELGD